MKNKSHQQLMNEAYKLYKDNMEADEFIETLDWKHKVAVVLGNLNYQVENGGFLQWIDNGYRYDQLHILQIIARRVISEGDKFPELKKALGYVISISDDTPNERLDKLDDEYYSLKNIEKEMQLFINTQ